MKKLIIVLLVLFLTGCGSATRYYLKDNPNAIPVSFFVDLDRDFVKSISSLGGGQTAMLILVGPFTNNAVLLEAKEMISDGEQIAFHQRLEWGDNELTSYLEKNKTYHLTVLVQGTRTGSKPIGKIEVGDTPRQHFSITLHGDKVSIQ